MYLGRIVGIGKTEEGCNLATYRVSSRSYPDRVAEISESADSVKVRSSDRDAAVDNEFISYTCVQVADNWLVVSNGSHTDAIAERLTCGKLPRAALESVLTEFGYERDGYNTPRIAGIISRHGNHGWLGVVREDGLEVEEIPLMPGRVRYVSTNEHSHLNADQELECHQKEPAAIAKALLESEPWLSFENPVTSVACIVSNNSFNIKTASIGRKQ